MSRFKDLYEKEIKQSLKSSLEIKNSMAVPKVVKVVVNAGVGRAIADGKRLEEAEEALRVITGQQPIRTKARKSIAGFKLREGMSIGTTVTLRGEKMYEFMDRLVNIALPRIRDFRGIKNTAFDGQGNYSLGIKEHTVFPELTGRDEEPVSLQVNIQTTANNKEEAQALLSAFGFPFKK
jgi:large subunit ribosomal protein L5